MRSEVRPFRRRRTPARSSSPGRRNRGFSVNQAILAAKAGATFISPFIGRLDDINLDGLQLIEDIRVVYDNYGFDTQILAALQPFILLSYNPSNKK